MLESELRERYFREAENSVALEGFNLSGDEFYQALKTRVIEGEIEAGEMMRLLVKDSKLKFRDKMADLAIAG